MAASCPDCYGSGFEGDTYRAAEWDAADPSCATDSTPCSTCSGTGELNEEQVAALLRCADCGHLARQHGDGCLWAFCPCTEPGSAGPGEQLASQGGRS